MNRQIVRHGLVLMLLALVAGMFVQEMPIPRLGLSAHTIGILSGVLLIALGAVWRLFTLKPLQQRVMYWSWVYSSYANWLACLIGAASGAGRMTPLASAGATGAAPVEALVAAMLISVVVTALLATGLSIYGLRSAIEAA